MAHTTAASNRQDTTNSVAATFRNATPACKDVCCMYVRPYMFPIAGFLCGCSYYQCTCMYLLYLTLSYYVFVKCRTSSLSCAGSREQCLAGSGRSSLKKRGRMTHDASDQLQMSRSKSKKSNQKCRSVTYWALPSTTCL